MRVNKLTVLLILTMAALAHRSDGQPAAPVAEQLRLAGVMPQGAMVYVQATDLGALMKTWLASPVRSQFYASESFAAFQKSRVYLKFQDRKKDFETATGIGIDENRLAELAGRGSAVSIYDIGKIELVFVSEVPRARVIASTLFKQAPQFQERSAEGTSYYVRDVTTDGGRLNQQFCFAYTDGKLIVTTTEGLMIRAIANTKAPGTDSLLADVVGLADLAQGFTTHDVTMWLDQTRLNRNRYFNNYWIHHNADGAMATIERGLIDLRMTREGMTEQRWFKTGAGRRGSGDGAISSEQLSALMKFAPADAQVIEVKRSSTEQISASVEKTLFGKLPEPSWAPPEIPDRTNKSSSDVSTRSERFSRLDARFDIDSDDEQAPRRGSGIRDEGPGKTTAPGSVSGDFVKSVEPILASNVTGASCEIVRSKAELGKPFVRFERAVVLQMKEGAAARREALERAIVDEMRARFVVAGIEPQLAWLEEGPVRFVSQSLLEQGAAYSMLGDFLVLASSRELVGDIIQASRTGRTAPERTGARVDSYSLIRIGVAKPIFDTLMSKLDGREQQAKTRKDDEEREVKFFSENLSSLISATAIRELRLTRQSSESMMTERVSYSW